MTDRRAWVQRLELKLAFAKEVFEAIRDGHPDPAAMATDAIEELRAPNEYGGGTSVRWLEERVGYQGDDCLPWPFCRDGRVGRGLLGYKGRQHWAHRLMCELAHGAPPTPKHQAAHTCGKGHYGCVNPRHLEWKTNSQNQLDRRKNGNMLRNQNGPRSNLSAEQIAELISLRDEMTQVALASKYGVSLGCVQYWLKYRETRGHNTGKLNLWTSEEEAKLRAGIEQKKSFRQISEMIGRPTHSISTKAYRLGLKSGWVDPNAAA